MWVESSHLCAKFSERVGKFSCFQIFYTSVTLLDIYLQVFFFSFNFVMVYPHQAAIHVGRGVIRVENRRQSAQRQGKTVQKGTNMAGARQQTESRRSREGENTGETLDIWRAPILGRNWEKQSLSIQRNQIWEPSQRLRNRSSSSWTGI